MALIACTVLGSRHQYLFPEFFLHSKPTTYPLGSNSPFPTPLSPGETSHLLFQLCKFVLLWAVLFWAAHGFTEIFNLLKRWSPFLAALLSWVEITSWTQKPGGLRRGWCQQGRGGGGGGSWFPFWGWVCASVHEAEGVTIQLGDLPSARTSSWHGVGVQSVAVTVAVTTVNLQEDNMNN